MKKSDIVLVFILVAIVFSWALYTNTPKGSIGSFNIQKERNEWSGRVNRDGPQQGYDEFVKENAVRIPGFQHSAAHLMGEVLYDTQGVSGVLFCDQSFAFGCYHGFFSIAIVTEGLNLVTKLDAQCLSLDKGKRSPCQHGIGHGVLQFLGYDHLNEALAECDRTERLGPMNGCPTGVFMEYNLRVLEDENGSLIATPRPLDQKDPYIPCESIPDRYRLSCYHELPSWWSTVLENNYAAVGELCTGISDPAILSGCLASVGGVIADRSGFDVTTVERECNTMSSNQYRNYCLIGAAQTFSWGEDTAPLASTICELADDLHGAQCP